MSEMNDYISREWLLAEYDRRHKGPPGGMRQLIKEAPATDVRPVVRCGECKYCVEHYDTDGNAPYWVCKEWDSGTDYDGYCYHGEKKGR